MEYLQPVRVRVWGERACFTRPEMKAERVSYSVMTPSAARGILEAIFWKPEFAWQVRCIEVLKPIRHFSMLRNEVNARANYRSQEAMIAGDKRTQRHTLGLRDVSYIINADVVTQPGVDEDPAKYRDQFRRRVEKGRCFHRPYLGCREFEAYFAKPNGDERSISLDEPLGMMLLDMEFAGSPPHKPHFFRAELKGGCLHVPDYDFNRREEPHADAAARD